MTGASITLTGVRKSFGDTPAVRELSTEIPAGSFTALLGPSGCGKSTTLAMIGGLLQPDTGDIRFDDRSQLGVPAERRPAGLVFQKPLLFPHLNVEQNVGFGLRMRRLDRARTRDRVAAILDRVQLTALARRRVGELSGGQQQRVALARALVLEPRILLLDEPFSQLDATLRAEMRWLVKDLHNESGVTTVFVTHDQAEAVEVADTIILLLDGRLEGQGNPEMFYTAAPSLAAARFFGVTNELPGTVSGGLFIADSTRLRRPSTLPDGPALLVVRPETLTLAGPSGADDTISGATVAARFAGTHLAVDVQLTRGPLVTVHVPVTTSVRLGAAVTVGVPPAAGVVLPADVAPAG
ncbi:MAG: ABC transporter ATP-binding protein [Nakamurella sp.]